MKKPGSFQQKMQSFCYQSRYMGCGCLYRICKSTQELERQLQQMGKPKKRRGKKA